MKTLLHHDGAIGDVLLSLPCIRFIKSSSSLLHVAARRDMSALLKEIRCADDVSTCDSAFYAPLYSGVPDNRLGDFLRGFDRSFVFTVNAASPLIPALRSHIPRTVAIATVPPDGTQMHVAVFRLHQFGPGAVGAGCHSMLEVPQKRLKDARELLGLTEQRKGSRPVVAIHPGSGGKKKRWPIENFFALADRLRDDGADLLFLSGPAEDAAAISAIDTFVAGRNGVIHIRIPELATVSALLSLCSLSIGNDSGISHLAAAVGCPVIALFGPTDSALWRPLGPHITVIAGNAGLDAVPPARISDVHAAAVRILTFPEAAAERT
jgi:ADP-heptose:LPS heptosyltransferase